MLRLDGFISHEMQDLLLRGEANAKATGRDMIEPFDLPVTKGWQENVHAFRSLSQDLQPDEELDRPAQLPPLALERSDETRDRLPEFAGRLSGAPVHGMKIVKPDLKNPGSEQRSRVCCLFDELM